MDFVLSLLAQTAPAAGGADKGSLIRMAVLMVAFVAFFYFAIVRPQNKKRKETEKMLNAMKKGDKVVTIGGIHGKISAVKEKEVVLTVDANTEITFEKSAIARVVSQAADVKKQTADEDSRESKKSVKKA